jgi:hypothetical protein
LPGPGGGVFHFGELRVAEPEADRVPARGGLAGPAGPGRRPAGAVAVITHAKISSSFGAATAIPPRLTAAVPGLLKPGRRSQYASWTAPGPNVKGPLWITRCAAFPAALPAPGIARAGATGSGNRKRLAAGPPGHARVPWRPRLAAARAVQRRERRLCWADRLPCPRIGAVGGPCPRETHDVPVSRERYDTPTLLNGPFIADKGPIVNTFWCGLMLISDAECGSVLSSDVCVAFPYEQEFAGNL